MLCSSERTDTSSVEATIATSRKKIPRIAAFILYSRVDFAGNTCDCELGLAYAFASPALNGWRPAVDSFQHEQPFCHLTVTIC